MVVSCTPLQRALSQSYVEYGRTKDALRKDQLRAGDLGFLSSDPSRSPSIIDLRETCRNGLARRNEINMKESWEGGDALGYDHKWQASRIVHTCYGNILLKHES